MVLKPVSKSVKKDVLKRVVKVSCVTLPKAEVNFPTRLPLSLQSKQRKSGHENNVPEFISAEDWSSGKSDLNPIDCKLWSNLENIVYKTPFILDSLKYALKKIAF